MNADYSWWLDDVARDHGGELDERPRFLPSFSDRPMSAAARAMIDARIVRHRVRRLPMTPEALAALQAFYREELQLLVEIGELTDRIAAARPGDGTARSCPIPAIGKEGSKPPPKSGLCGVLAVLPGGRMASGLA
jgi:hypothetical protein